MILEALSTFNDSVSCKAEAGLGHAARVTHRVAKPDLAQQEHGAETGMSEHLLIKKVTITYSLCHTKGSV